MLVLDINDAEITLRRNGEELYRQPGVANVAAKTTVLGQEARARVPDCTPSSRTTSSGNA